MHHLDLGLFHYQIEYTRFLIKKQHSNSLVDEMDRRLAAIPRFSGLKIFSNRIQSIARLTASEYRDLMKVMLFVVDNLYNQNINNVEDYIENKELTSLYQNWNEMYLISKYEKFTESDLIKFQVCIIIFMLLYKKNIS
jgi:hypothetical protein